MQLSLYINGKYRMCWPVDLPEKKRTLTDEENFNIREKVIQDTLAMAKMDVVDLLEGNQWEFFFQAKARVQPKSFTFFCKEYEYEEVFKLAKIKLPKLPVPPEPKVVRLPGVYSNVKSLYK